MKIDKKQEKAVRKELFILTHINGYGSEKMEEVFKTFMKDYVNHNLVKSLKEFKNYDNK